MKASPKKARLLSAWSNIYESRSRVKGRKITIYTDIKEKPDEFLSSENINFNLPGNNNQVYVGKGDDQECQYKAKKFLL